MINYSICTFIYSETSKTDLKSVKRLPFAQNMSKLSEKELIRNMQKKNKECPNCAMQIDSKAKLCPICEYEFPKQSLWIQVVAILLIIAFLLVYIL